MAAIWKIFGDFRRTLKTVLGYSRDISALSVIDMRLHNIALYKFLILFYSTTSTRKSDFINRCCSLYLACTVSCWKPCVNWLAAFIKLLSLHLPLVSVVSLCAIISTPCPVIMMMMLVYSHLQLTKRRQHIMIERLTDSPLVLTSVYRRSQKYFHGHHT